MADHMPNDLLTEILARLPVVSLLRFKSVCKPWYSLITSPSFVTKHLNQSITNTESNGDKLLLRLYDDKKERYLLLNDDDEFGDEYSELELPFELPFGCYRVVGSYNGLLCLSDDYYSSGQPQIIIWNPSTRNSVIILPTAPKPQCPYVSVYGFGAHPTTQEYKVIRLEYKLQSLFKLPPKVEIYTQGTRSWRGISSAPPHCFLTSRWSQAFLNGVVHWVYESFCECVPPNLIMSFDMASESFSVLMLPTTLAEEPWTPILYSVKLFGESLALFCDGQSYDNTCCIWVMKEYGVAESWTKLFTFKILGMPHKIFGFRKNGEVLQASKTSLASYAPATETLRDTGIMISLSALVSFDSFRETLVLVE
ncbi:F-box protein CPR1-like [Rhododendron vialii]|uniref:F-box protein CPR1-like n=1 Tax=Rhododendron vialii TaxID=182163 RepID=UPI00265DD9C8|nr:F-box protein CPR1-like [Rhododendron vialii]